MPTAIRVASLRLLHALLTAVDGLVAAFETKAAEWAEVRKAGRTHLHDATPMTLGQEFAGYAANVRRAADRVRATEASLGEVPLGGTAIGTGINTAPGFAGLAVGHLAAITGLPLREAPDRIASQQSLGDFVALSGALRGLAVELSKIANDLRLLSSGPHTGLDEIELPALQPGSSIMPGKVNPVVAEMLNMACFHVIGHDVAITMAGEAGQLELNVMLPYVAYALLDSLDVLAHAVATFDTKTVRLLEAHRDRCAYYAERTVGAATALNDELGFQGAAEVAQEAIRSGRTVAEVMAERRAESGKQQRDGGASAWRRGDVQLTADQHRPLVHAEQAETAALPARRRRRRRRHQPDAVVGHRQDGPAPSPLERDLHLGGGGVLVDVVQRLLHDAEGLRFDLVRQPSGVHADGAERGRDPERRRPVGDRLAQHRQEPQLVEAGGTEIAQQEVDVLVDAFGGLLDGVDATVQLFVFGRTGGQPFQLEAQRRDLLAEIVVDVPRDAPPLGFLQRQHAPDELHVLAACLLARGLEPPALGHVDHGHEELDEGARS